jgi:saccharopine dehydrogenase-like NADP-dependent oxidoreductase
MKILVLGGCGIQGRAALYDLSRNVAVDHITCADIQPELVDSFDFIDKAKIQIDRIDARDPNALTSKMVQQKKKESPSFRNVAWIQVLT